MRTNTQPEPKAQLPLWNDEGMWTLDNVPVERLRERYGFTPNAQWIQSVMHSCVRLNSGGSGGFVSRQGLFITNHHVAEPTLGDLRTEEHNLIAAGFHAETMEQEVPAKHLEVNVLQEIVDVTDQVNGAVKGLSASSAIAQKKRAVIAEIEAMSKEETGLRSDVVTLYQGGVYHLYRYKRYTDIRLVFAPEKAIASLGGDIDNFTFPRYCLDIAFFRVYENGKPLETPEHFSWSNRTVTEENVLFIAGHPGHTDRISTTAKIRHLRDSGLPYALELQYRREVLFQQFSGQSKRNKEIAEHDLNAVQNNRKRFEGQRIALADQRFIQHIEEREHALIKDVSSRVDLGYAMEAWGTIERAEEHLRTIRGMYNMIEGGHAFNSIFFRIARGIVRLADEDGKPNHERLEEYQDAGRDSLLHALFDPSPIYPEFEEWKLADSFLHFAEKIGHEHPLVKEALASLSPQERAHELVAGTLLADVNRRTDLVFGGKNAVRSSPDPFIRLALLVDKDAREVRQDMKENVETVREGAYGKIARARFELYGASLYPDATFTLRLAYGQARGYAERGQEIPSSTKMREVFAHAKKHGYEGYWKLPKSWVTLREKIEEHGAIDFNFVTTHDSHGGNSGSPVFNEKREFVGCLFDGNIYANAGTFLYADAVERSISVHATGIITALQTVYGATRLVDELLDS